MLPAERNPMKLQNLIDEYQKLIKILNGDYGPITSLDAETVGAIALEYIKPNSFKPYLSLAISFRYIDSITIDIQSEPPGYILRPFNIATDNLANSRSEIIAGPMNQEDFAKLLHCLTPNEEITRDVIKQILPQC